MYIILRSETHCSQPIGTWHNTHGTPSTFQPGGKLGGDRVTDNLYFLLLEPCKIISSAKLVLMLNYECLDSQTSEKPSGKSFYYHWTMLIKDGCKDELLFLS